MKKKYIVTLLLALVLGLGMLTVGDEAQAEAKQLQKRSSDTDCISPKMVELKTAMQKAWIDHTIWTRSYIVSAMSNRPDQPYVLERLLQNQQDIGNLIKPYYGEAAKANNQADVKKLNADWHRNADDIAKFLSEANPNWTFKELQDMLYTHLKLINEIVISCLQGDWKRDIQATDENEIHMIHLADILTEGIVKQFPEKF